MTSDAFDRATDRLFIVAKPAELRELALHILGDEADTLGVLDQLAARVDRLSTAVMAAPVQAAQAPSDPAADDDAVVDEVLAAVGYERAR